MKFLLGILILVLSFFLLVFSYFINEIRKYLIWKRNINTNPLKDASMIISCTNDFLKLISDRIDEEINCHFQKYVLLQEKYPLQRLDDDIKAISNKVYEGLKPSMFEINKNDFALNTEYFMRYIVNTTKLRVTGYMKEWNDSLNTITIKSTK